MVVISSYDINQYRNGPPRPDITDVEWTAGKLDPKVLRKLPNLATLKFAFSTKTLTGIEACPQLTYLNCSWSMLRSLEGFQVLKKLVYLDCSHNNLSTLDELACCTELTELHCDYNKLIRLPSISSLRKLICSNCNLATLEGLGVCSELLSIECWENRLSSLKGLETCVKLEYLNCHQNSVTSLLALKACTRLKDVCFSHNKLQSLAGLNCGLLQNLGCSNNPLIKPKPLNAPLLEVLYCDMSNLTNLKLIEGCPQLKYLNCSRNKLTDLQELSNCPLLETLYCFNNSLTSLDHVQGCSLLQKLNCDNNRIESLVPLRCCPDLRDLSINYNRLTTLEGIEACTSIDTIHCQSNQLLSLQNLVYLRHLRYLTYNNNPFGVESVQVTRFMERFRHGRTNINSIYDDRQNVHDFYIQKTVCESVKKLMTDPKPSCAFDAIRVSDLDPQAIELVTSYCEDSCVHSVHLLTYSELLMYVWARIMNHEHKSELIKILGEQILESRDLCFTGRFNRTLSALVGFYPDIIISISDNSRIGAIILKAREAIDPYDPLTHIKLAQSMLTDAGYGADEIKPWLEAIV